MSVGWVQGLAMGLTLQHANFKITCLKSNISFDLECNTNNNNEITSKYNSR